MILFAQVRNFPSKENTYNPSFLEISRKKYQFFDTTSTINVSFTSNRNQIGFPDKDAAAGDSSTKRHEF